MGSIHKVSVNDASHPPRRPRGFARPCSSNGWPVSPDGPCSAPKKSSPRFRGRRLEPGRVYRGQNPTIWFRRTRSVDCLHCDKSQAVLLTGTALPQPRTSGAPAIMTRITMDRGRPSGGGFREGPPWLGAASPRQATWARHLAARRLAARHLAAHHPAMAFVALTVATVTITRSATRPKTTAGCTTSASLCGVAQSMKLLAHQLP